MENRRHDAIFTGLLSPLKEQSWKRQQHIYNDTLNLLVDLWNN